MLIRGRRGKEGRACRVVPAAPVDASAAYIVPGFAYTKAKANRQTFFQIHTMDAYNNSYTTGGAEVRGLVTGV